MNLPKNNRTMAEKASLQHSSLAKKWTDGHDTHVDCQYILIKIYKTDLNNLFYEITETTHKLRAHTY